MNYSTKISIGQHFFIRLKRILLKIHTKKVQSYRMKVFILKSFCHRMCNSFGVHGMSPYSMEPVHKANI